MTDRGRGDADGSARGTVTGGKGRSDRERDADADARKVVPFPREWYGSPDELMPIDLGRTEGDATDAAGSDAVEAANSATRRLRRKPVLKRDNPVGRSREVNPRLRGGATLSGYLVDNVRQTERFVSPTCASRGP